MKKTEENIPSPGKSAAEAQDVRLLQRNRRKEDLIRDFAVLGLLACILAGGGLIAAAGETYLFEGMITYLVMGAGIKACIWMWKGRSPISGEITCRFL